jgi:stage II sporulation protein D
MEVYHKLETIDGVEQIVLYVDYPSDYEFSLDFDNLKKNVSNVADKIREYAFKNIPGISNQTALVVLNGVIVGTLVLSNLTAPTNLQKLNNTETLSKIENPITNTESTNTNTQQSTTPINEESLKKDEVINTEENKTIEQSVPDSTQVAQSTNTVKKIETTSTSTPATNNTAKASSQPSTTTTTTTQNASTPVTVPVTTAAIQEKMVSLKLSSGQTISISLENYVVGVVGAEMPASFGSEALKAQAVVARTYALKRIESGQTLAASTSNQVYKTDAELKTLWGNSYSTYYSKVKNAVEATKGEYITYGGKYIDALYFSTSNGKTEDPINVWGNSFPYLKSVDSSWDKNVSGFSQTKSIAISTVCSKLGVTISSSSQIVINSKTIGDRVASAIIGGKNFTGVQVRNLLGLRSADFNVSQDGQNIVFTTRGYGHGVGMSQYGANEMSKAGKTYSNILYHYYTGVKIQK